VSNVACTLISTSRSIGPHARSLERRTATTPPLVVQWALPWVRLQRRQPRSAGYRPIPARAPSVKGTDAPRRVHQRDSSSELASPALTISRRHPPLPRKLPRNRCRRDSPGGRANPPIIGHRYHDNRGSAIKDPPVTASHRTLNQRKSNVRRRSA